MPTSTPYETIINAFAVIQIAGCLHHVLPSDDLSEVQEKLFNDPFNDLFLVRDSQRIYGYFDSGDLFDCDEQTKPMDIINEISPTQIVPATMSLLDLLPLFEQHKFFFVLTQNDLTHIVSFSDLDKLPMKLCLFSLFLELESEMLQHLFLQNDENYLGCLSAARLRKAEELCGLKYKKITQEETLLCTTFIDKATIFTHHPALSQILPFTQKRSVKEFFTTVERLRNQVAHSDSIFRVIDQPKALNSFINEVRQTVRLLLNATESKLRELEI